MPNHPTQVAFAAFGSPLLDAADMVGICCLCGDTAELRQARAVVSARFTDYDLWGRGGGLCPTCTWAYRHGSRQQPTLITITTAAMTTTSEIASLLQTGALTQAAVALPISGRKHVLPYAAWRTVRIDGLNLVWTDADAAVLRVFAELRSQFSCRELAEPAPPWSTLNRYQRSDWDHVLTSWRFLDGWRHPRGPHWAIATKLAYPETAHV